MFLFLSLFLFSFLLIEGPALSTKFNKNRIHSFFDTQCQVSIVSSPAATVVAAAATVAAAAHCDLVTHSLNEGIVCVGVM